MLGSWEGELQVGEIRCSIFCGGISYDFLWIERCPPPARGASSHQLFQGGFLFLHDNSFELFGLVRVESKAHILAGPDNIYKRAQQGFYFSTLGFFPSAPCCISSHQTFQKLRRNNNLSVNLFYEILKLVLNISIYFTSFSLKRIGLEKKKV